VLSGPGHCTKSRHHHLQRNLSSLVHISRSNIGSAVHVGGRQKGIVLVPLNLPHQISSTSNAVCTVMFYTCDA